MDSATEDANNIRIGAVQYTDDMLGKLQYIIEHSIKDNKEKYTSLMTGLENVLTVVTNNRKSWLLKMKNHSRKQQSRPKPWRMILKMWYMKKMTTF